MAVGVGRRTAVFVGGTIAGGAVSVGLISIVFVGCCTGGTAVSVALAGTVSLARETGVPVGISTDVLVGAGLKVLVGSDSGAKVSVGCSMAGAGAFVFVTVGLGRLVGGAAIVPVGSSIAALGEPVAAGVAVSAGGTKAGALFGTVGCGRREMGVGVAELPPHPLSANKMMSSPVTATSLVTVYSLYGSRFGLGSFIGTI
jgi:hypothetical protein